MSWHFQDDSNETYEAYVYHERPNRQAPGTVKRGPAMLGFLHVRTGTVRAKMPLPRDFPERPSSDYLQQLFRTALRA